MKPATRQLLSVRCVWRRLPLPDPGVVVEHWAVVLSHHASTSSSTTPASPWSSNAPYALSSLWQKRKPVTNSIHCFACQQPGYLQLPHAEEQLVCNAYEEH